MPISPLTPFAPVLPWGPCAPIAPLAPCAPVGPVGPTLPIGPMPPTLPLAPVLPIGPCAPIAPLAPCAPVLPWGPIAPMVPLAPLVLLWTSPLPSTTKKSVKAASVSVVAIFNLPPIWSFVSGSATPIPTLFPDTTKSFWLYSPAIILSSAKASKTGKPAASFTDIKLSDKSSLTLNRVPSLP